MSAARQWPRHVGRLDPDHAGGAAARAAPSAPLDAKLAETVRALQIEWTLTKDEILTLYLTLAPYGGNLEGVRAASLAYFGREPRRLTLRRGRAPGRAAAVAGSAGPTATQKRRKRARDRVLDRIAGHGSVQCAEIAHAKQETVPSGRKPIPLVAPHAADQALSRTKGEHAIS